MWWKGALVGVMVVVATSCIFNEDFTTTEDVCVNVCDCTSLFPTDRQQCVDSCIENLDGFAVPQQCLDCFAAASCGDLRTDNDLCDVECQFFAAALPATN